MSKKHDAVKNRRNARRRLRRRREKAAATYTKHMQSLDSQANQARSDYEGWDATPHYEDDYGMLTDAAITLRDVAYDAEKAAEALEEYAEASEELSR